MDKKKIGIVCAIVVVAFLIVGFATNWFAGPKASDSPSAKIEEKVEEVKQEVEQKVEEVEQKVEEVTAP